jgi:hypothetical protein
MKKPLLLRSINRKAKGDGSTPPGQATYMKRNLFQNCRCCGQEDPKNAKGPRIRPDLAKYAPLNRLYSIQPVAFLRHSAADP